VVGDTAIVSLLYQILACRRRLGDARDEAGFAYSWLLDCERAESVLEGVCEDLVIAIDM
jgi:hypothetical protein